MENIEFIAAKDLPATEAEEVDVLCVENGELKRKPGASLGGGGGSYDIVIRHYVDLEKETTVTELVEGTFNAAYQKIANNLPVTALIIEDFTALESIEGEMPYKAVAESNLNWFKLDSGEALIGFGCNCEFQVLPDDTAKRI